MGGVGSGRRWHSGSKNTTEDCRSIDVRHWARKGLLTPGQAFSYKWSRNGEIVASIGVYSESDRVTLSYRHRSGGGDWMDESYPVQLDWTSCTLGGQRPWFLCPANGCGGRVAILYCRGIFACRHCYQLAYPSQREVAYDRAARRADRIREKLGWEPGILNGNGWKRKGMHWRTYYRLTAKYNAYATTSFDGIKSRLGLL
jgi:hypothetical protein